MKYQRIIKECHFGLDEKKPKSISVNVKDLQRIDVVTGDQTTDQMEVFEYLFLALFASWNVFLDLRLSVTD